MAISLKELEKMIDSSLSRSDKVHFDHKEYRGEVYLWRHAHWRYFPVDFEILYRVEATGPLISKFFYRDVIIDPSGHANLKDAIADTVLHNIPDTNTYRLILMKADLVRRNVP